MYFTFNTHTHTYPVFGQWHIALYCTVLENYGLHSNFPLPSYSKNQYQHIYNRWDPTAWLTISIFPISGSALNIGNVWLGKCFQIFCTDYSITDLWHFTFPLPFCHFYGNQFNISKVCLFTLYFHCAISFNNRGSFYLLRKKRKVGT